MEKGFTRTTLHRVVATLEYKSDYGTAVRDARGNIQMIIPKSSLGLYAKMIAIAAGFDALTSRRPFRDAYGPEIAMMLMWSELRHKFDPDLLRVFMRVLAIPPVKVLSKRGSRARCRSPACEGLRVLERRHRRCQIQRHRGLGADPPAVARVGESQLPGVEAPAGRAVPGFPSPGHRPFRVPP